MEQAYRIKVLQQEVYEWAGKIGRIHDIPNVQKGHIDFYGQSLVSEKISYSTLILKIL
jgi:fido (protein-threonine AMPylation protein)